jgi:hypothetical protein
VILLQVAEAPARSPTRSPKCPIPGSDAERMAGDPPGPELGCRTGDRLDVSTHTIASPLSNKEDSALDPCIALSKEGMGSEPATERVGECAVGYVHSHTGGRQTVRAYRACREKTCVCARQASPCMRCHRGG